jgi:myo-inositol-1(or 4)-monophosphatase
MPRRNPSVRRGLAGVPGSVSHRGPWHGRKTGSAALECALVAAGLLRVASFRRPNIWDIAGGVCLVSSAGGDVRVKNSNGWEKMDGFEPAPAAGSGRSDLRNWRRSIVIGDKDATELMCR